MSESTPREGRPALAGDGDAAAVRLDRNNVLSYEVGRLRHALPLVVSRCMAYSAMTRFDNDLIAAVKEFYGLELDVATAEAEILEDEDERVRFFPWFLWDWRTLPELPTLGERFLAEGDHAPHEARLLEGLCGSYVGFYEALEDAGPCGAWVRDLATGERMHVVDDGLEGELPLGHILQARLVRAESREGQLVLVDAVYASLPPEARAPVVSELTAVTEGLYEGPGAPCPPWRRQVSVVAALELYVAEMLHFTDHLLDVFSRPPDALNDDGDPLVLSRTKVRCRDRDEIATAAAMLAASDAFRASPHEGLLVFRPNGAALGHVDVRSPGGIVLGANSPARLDALVGGFAAMTGLRPEPIRSLQDFNNAVRGWAEEGGGEVWLTVDPEVRGAVHRWFDSWAPHWVDTPSSLLGNRTPREAVSESDGRRRVEAMLRRFERLRRRRLGAPDRQLEAIREELGL